MRKILVVIDMQRDFIDGALGTAEARAIVPAVIEKIKGYAPEDVFATRDTHGEDYLNTQEGRYLPVEHCIRGTAGWELNPEIAAMPEVKISVDAACCAGVTPEKHAAALETLRSCQVQCG